MIKKIFIAFFLLILLMIPVYLYNFYDDGIKDPKESTLAILPYENFPNEYSELIANKLKEFYGFQTVIILPSQKLPKEAYTTVNTARYRADSILHILDRNTDLDKYDYILALTEKDISCTKNKEPKSKYRDWGIFGLGQCPGQCCVVSIFRMGKAKVGEKTFLERFLKICCHEIGHNLGLPHCPMKGCIMQDANETINTIDGEKGELCGECKKKLKG
jgi:archaemetzincin